MAVLAEYRLGLIGRDTPLVVEQDRRTAIAVALHEGRPGDVVLVAGRGAEPLLRVHGTAQRFVDREVVEELLGAGLPAA
jgi:UDP-N-acetylmuramoyl-L-alanyl-D-glutamate--2,6-diaminopimelate ligase